MKRSVVKILTAMLVAVSISPAQSTQAGSTSAPKTDPKPLLLEKDDGERRLWRPEPGEVDPGGFILKVTPQSNGSQHLMLLTEDMPPGAAIPTHKHLEQDEVVLIEKGTIHAHVGDQERDLHVGGMVFIPAHTWVSLKNAGTETASMVAIFFSAWFRGSFAMRIGAGERETDNHFPSRRKPMRSLGACCLQRPRRKRPEFRNHVGGNCKTPPAGER
jgi:quercetin dioxygenase-like cupin family protein